MKRFSMFECFDDIEKYRAYCTDEPVWSSNPDYEYAPVKEGFMTGADVFGSILGESASFTSDNVTTRNAYAYLYSQKDYLYKIYDIDIFFWINFTCDYLLNCDSNLLIEQGKENKSYISIKETEFTSDFIKKEFGCKVELNENAFEFFRKNSKKILLVPDENFKITERGSQSYAMIPKLCKNFYFYMFNNLSNMKSFPLYSYWEKRETKERYLYKNISDILSGAVAYNFDYSDYFIFEKLTGLYYATTLSCLFEGYISKKLEKKFDKCDYSSRIQTFLNGIIMHGRYTNMTYGRSIMSKSFFNHVTPYFKDECLLDKILLQVKAQFEKALGEGVITKRYSYQAYKKFYELYDEYFDGHNKVEAIVKIKQRIIKDFESSEYNLPYCQLDWDDTNKANDYWFRGRIFIPDKQIEDIANAHFNEKKIRSSCSVFNSYIQQHLIIGCPAPEMFLTRNSTDEPWDTRRKEGEKHNIGDEIFEPRDGMITIIPGPSYYLDKIKNRRDKK